MKGTLVFDVETHSADLLYSMEPDEFVRLIGYRWKGRETVITTDIVELREQILRARWVIGHNITMFDLPAVFGTASNIPLDLAKQGRLYDTWVHAVLVNPAPYTYINRKGKAALAAKPPQMKAWFALDEQAFQLGVAGKTGDLKALAKEFGGYGEIPIDDPRYVEYLRGDVEASDVVARELLKKGPLDAYAVREQEIQARAAVISTNGFRVDVQVAQARVDKLAARRQVILEGLQADYGLPTEGKAPWATNAGKAAIMAALADYQITPKTRKDWTLTATGNYSLGGETLIGLTKGTPAEELGIALAELKGQRTLAQLALDSVQPDGMVHPEISMLQRSGRWSTTEPGLTVWTARGPGAVEKEYFIPDSEDHALVGFDYSNADARAVAAYSGDRGYAERFKPGKDGHMINAVVAWGQSVVDTDPEGYRQKAKVPGHGWGYLIGPKKLARSTGMPVQEAKQFLGNMNDAYAGVVRWQRQCTYYASQHGYVVNDWGRRMWVERGREYTQAPALIGQSATREIICDALLAMPISVLRMVKAQIHDELILSIPKEGLEVTRKQVIELMQTSFSPKGGQTIDFPVDSGSPGKNWYEASH